MSEIALPLGNPGSCLGITREGIGTFLPVSGLYMYMGISDILTQGVLVADVIPGKCQVVGVSDKGVVPCKRRCMLCTLFHCLFS